VPFILDFVLYVEKRGRPRVRFADIKDALRPVRSVASTVQCNEEMS